MGQWEQSPGCGQGCARCSWERETDLDSDSFSGAQRVELTQNRFFRGSAGTTRSWLGAAAGGVTAAVEVVWLCPEQAPG